MHRLFLVIASMLLFPLATSAPIAYVGAGTATIERAEADSIFDCDTRHLAVAIFPTHEGWYVQMHAADFHEAEDITERTPCNYTHAFPIAFPEGVNVPLTGPVSVKGSPETGFLVDFSEECRISTYRYGPLGPATEYRQERIYLCGQDADDEWANGTIAFEGFV